LCRGSILLQEHERRRARSTGPPGSAHSPPQVHDVIHAVELGVEDGSVLAGRRTLLLDWARSLYLYRTWGLRLDRIRALLLDWAGSL